MLEETSSRIVQLIASDREELWEFPVEISDDQIKEYYNEYLENYNYDSFEEFMEAKYIDLNCGRIFIDEIYI